MPEPRELASPVQLGKDFRGVVDRDFSIRSLRADDAVTPEDVAAPKASDPSVTEPVLSQTLMTSENSLEDLIPSPEDHSAPVEPGPTQLPSEEESIEASSVEIKPGVVVPPAVPPTPISSSLSEVK